MREIYKLDTLFEGNEIGTWPQSHVLLPQDIHGKIIKGIEIDRNLFRNYIIGLNKGAKLTDFISNAELMFSFVINKRVKEVLERHKIGESYFIPIVLKQSDQFIEGYYLFIVRNDLKKYVDLKKTSFFIANKFRRNKDKEHEGITFNSWDQIKEKNKQIRKTEKRKVYFENMALNLKEESYDAFTLPYQTFVFISKQLNEELIRNKFSGMDSFLSKIPEITIV